MQFAALDTLVAQNKQLESDLNDLRNIIPNYYSQEELIVMLDEMSAASGLEVIGINFGGPTIQATGDFETGLTLSAPGGADAASAAAATDTTTTDSSPVQSGIQNVQSEMVTVSFSGSYAQLSDFLFTIEAQARKVYFRNMTLNRADDGTLTGTIDILAISSVNADSTDYPGYMFAAPAAEGKDDPFAAFDGYDSTAAATGASEQDSPEFYLILNTYDDNANKILMGQYPASSTQVTSDSNKKVAASLTLSGTIANCNYTYTLDGSSYSGTIQLTDSGVLSLSVLSRDRKNTADKVGVTLSVVNNLDKTLVINVSNDDAADPRFVLGSTTGPVQLSR